MATWDTTVNQTTSIKVETVITTIWEEDIKDNHHLITCMVLATKGDSTATTIIHTHLPNKTQ